MEEIVSVIRGKLGAEICMKVKLYLRHPLMEKYLMEMYEGCRKYSLDENAKGLGRYLEFYLDELKDVTEYKYGGFVDNSGFSPGMVIGDGLVPQGEEEEERYRICLLSNICYTGRVSNGIFGENECEYRNYLMNHELKYVYKIWINLETDGIEVLMRDKRKSEINCN